MGKGVQLSELVSMLEHSLIEIPEHRTGDNTVYEIKGAWHLPSYPGHLFSRALQLKCHYQLATLRIAAVFTLRLTSFCK